MKITKPKYKLGDIVVIKSNVINEMTIPLDYQRSFLALNEEDEIDCNLLQVKIVAAGYFNAYGNWYYQVSLINFAADGKEKVFTYEINQNTVEYKL